MAIVGEQSRRRGAGSPRRVGAVASRRDEQSRGREKQGLCAAAKEGRRLGEDQGRAAGKHRRRTGEEQGPALG